MSQSSDSLPILTLSNWYSWEQRAINAIANFGEAGKAIINNIPYVLEEPCQSAVIQCRQQYVDPIDGLSKIRVADLGRMPWTGQLSPIKWQNITALKMNINPNVKVHGPF